MSEETEARSNDLFEYKAAATKEMASDYEVISKRSREDAGTAGSQGEEN
jgi:hypothetical protein